MSVIVKKQPTSKKVTPPPVATQAASGSAPKTEAELLDQMRTHFAQNKGLYDALGR